MTCPKPVGITNGEIVGNTNYTDGTRVYYSCNPGFTMTGTTSQLCQSGAWVGEAPTCALTTTKTSVELSGLSIPLWLFIVLIILLAVLLLGIAVYLMCYFCCRYCCVFGSRCEERGVSFRQTDNRFRGTYYSNRSFTRDQATGTPPWTDQRSEVQRKNKASQLSAETTTNHRSVEKTAGPRVIRVLPGEPFVILPEDATESGDVKENRVSGTGNKEYPRVNNNVSILGASGEILGPYSISSNEHSNRFKPKATHIKHANMWMPHSQPIRKDVAHMNSVTR